ncbi:MAG: hypothetical protein IJ704_01575 [Bacilli bacterium]|nr:hypothetical protein [Bacilli bacterium]
MKNDITKALWYRNLVEKCNSEPDRIHSIIIEKGFLSNEEYKQLLQDCINQLQLLPKNAQLTALLDGNVINLTDYQLKIAEEEKAWSELGGRFKQVDFSNLAQDSENEIHKIR